MTGDPDLISKIISEQSAHVTHIVKVIEQKLSQAKVN